MKGEEGSLNGLIQRCLHQEAGDEEFERLQTRLRDDPEARKRYLAAGQLEADLVSLFGQEESEEVLPVISGKPSVKPSWLAVAALCSLVALVLAALAFFRPGSAPSIATAVSAGAKAWIVDGAAIPPDEAVELGAATRVELPEGAAGRIQLFPDVTLQLAGKGDLTLIDRFTVQLDHGVLHAEVGEQSHGFTVRTQEGVIVDLGTRFAVDAPEEGGDILITVFEGSVEVSPRGGTAGLLAKTGQHVRLHHGVAETVDPQALDRERHALLRSLDSGTGSAGFTVLHHYPLGESGSVDDGVPLDAAGNAHFGRSREDPILYVSAPDAPAPGSSSFARFAERAVATDARLDDVPTDNVAVEIWARPDSPEEQNVCLFTTHGSRTEGLRLRLVKGNWAASIGEGHWIGSPRGEGQPAASRWTHLAVIRQGGHSTFYIDGIAQDGTTTAPLAHGNAHLGGTPFGGTQPTYSGDLDEIRIFSFPTNTPNPARHLRVGD